MKTMNNKMAKIHIYQRLNLKSKLSNKKNRDRIMDTESILIVARWEGGVEGMGEEVRGIRSTNRQLQTSQGEVKYSTGNGVAKELIRMTHGHEQQWWYFLREWGVLVRGGANGQKLDL